MKIISLHSVRIDGSGMISDTPNNSENKLINELMRH